ncbi:MAG: SprT family zinc-dependent metalloprotease [Pseudomonadota bacterium]
MAERIRLDDPDVEVALRRSARARRLTLTVPGGGEPPRVTAPKGVPLSEIRMFLYRQADWLQTALERAPDVVAVRTGASIPVAGRTVRIIHQPGRRRPPSLSGDALVIEGGSGDDAAKRIAVWLRERARAAVTPIAEDCAEALGGRLGRISLRDPKSRWGSCNARGDLSFSWRLAMAPPAVLDYVAAHEAAHLIEMNHSSRFWALVERLRPDWREQRDWLKREGAALHRYRFDS